MKSIRLNIFLAILLTISISTHVKPAFSQSSKYQLSQQAQAELTSVQDLMQRNEFQTALEVLNTLQTAVRNQRYDLAITYQTIGYVYSNLNSNKEAIQAFTKAIQTGALPKSVNHEIEYIVAQLLISEGSYAQGMKYLSTWFRNEKNPSAEAHYIAATAYYFLDNYKQMVYQARNAISKRKNAPASWYEILLSGYYETNDLIAAADLMETMLKNFPQRTQYWMQLAGIYLSIKKNQQALALMEVAYIKGIVNKHQELIQLAQTYLYMDMPYKAANLLSTEMENQQIKKTKETVKLLADSWFLARETEKGIDVLSAAITQIKDAEIYYRLGQLYVAQEDWNNAVKILNQTIQTTDFENIADAYLLLGVAALQGNDKSTSYRALNNALKYDSTKEQARQWMAELRN